MPCGDFRLYLHDFCKIMFVQKLDVWIKMAVALAVDTNDL